MINKPTITFIWLIVRKSPIRKFTYNLSRGRSTGIDWIDTFHNTSKPNETDRYNLMTKTGTYDGSSLALTFLVSYSFDLAYHNTITLKMHSLIRNSKPNNFNFDDEFFIIRKL